MPIRAAGGSAGETGAGGAAAAGGAGASVGGGGGAGLNRWLLVSGFGMLGVPRILALELEGGGT